MITLDASVLIAHLDNGDRHHQAATGLLRSRADEPLVMHALNLAEVLVAAVRNGRGDGMLADAEAIGIRVADPVAGEPLRLATLRVATGLKLPDCCALDTAMVSGSTLATFDGALIRAATERRVPVAPDP